MQQLNVEKGAQKEPSEILPVFLGPGVFPSSTSASEVPAVY